MTTVRRTPPPIIVRARPNASPLKARELTYGQINQIVQDATGWRKYYEWPKLMPPHQFDFQVAGIGWIKGEMILPPCISDSQKIEVSFTGMALKSPGLTGKKMHEIIRTVEIQIAAGIKGVEIFSVRGKLNNCTAPFEHLYFYEQRIPIEKFKSKALDALAEGGIDGVFFPQWTGKLLQKGRVIKTYKVVGFDRSMMRG